MKSHSNSLGEMPIPRLLWKMSAPGVVSMLVLATYNLVDAIFVGRFVGATGLAALAANIPVIFLIMGERGDSDQFRLGIGGGWVVKIFLPRCKLKL